MKNEILFKLALIGSLAVGLQADFIRDNTKNIVKDKSTLLVWQDDEVVKTTTRSWADALTYCEGLTLGGYDDWRLPNQNELISIIDKTRTNPSLSPTFANFASDVYWSSTTYKNYTDNVWLVSFDNGAENAWGKTNSLYVRCVRAGQ